MRRIRHFRSPGSIKARFRDDLGKNIKGLLMVGVLVAALVSLVTYLGLRRQPTEILREEIGIVEELVAGSLATTATPASSAAMVRLTNGQIVKAATPQGLGVSPHDRVRLRTFRRRDGTKYYRVLRKLEKE